MQEAEAAAPITVMSEEGGEGAWGKIPKRHNGKQNSRLATAVWAISDCEKLKKHKPQ